MKHRRAPRVVAVYLLLLIAGVPWYWPDDVSGMVAGLPLWVAVSLLATFCASAWTAWLFLHPDGEDDDPR